MGAAHVLVPNLPGAQSPSPSGQGADRSSDLICGFGGGGGGTSLVELSSLVGSAALVITASFAAGRTSASQRLFPCATPGAGVSPAASTAVVPPKVDTQPCSRRLSVRLPFPA